MAFQWDTSWTNSQTRTVQGAIDRLTKMLTGAYISSKAVPRDVEANQKYTRCFSDAPHAHLALVQATILSMYNRVTKSNEHVIMSYVPTVAAYNALGAGPLPAGVNLDHVEAFTNQNNILPAVNLTCYIGPAFFKGDVYIPHAPDQRSGTGTILHELSHGVSGAIDHMYTWDANYHTLTALQRAENADTYREYCQLFDT